MAPSRATVWRDKVIPAAVSARALNAGNSSNRWNTAATSMEWCAKW